MTTRLGKKILTEADFTAAHRAALLKLYCGSATRRGLTQAQLAKKLGTSGTLIGKVLRSTPGFLAHKPSRSGGHKLAGHSPHTLELARQVAELDAAGVRSKEIAKLISKSRVRVSQLRKIQQP